jgi:hypothetical protein
MLTRGFILAMTVGVDAVLQQIDAVLREAQSIRQTERTVGRVITGDAEYDRRPAQHYSTPNDEDVARANALMLSALSRFSPPGSPYVEQARVVLAKSRPDDARDQLLGMVRALRFEYANGAMLTVEQLVHADLFADFIEMARYLLEKGFKDPAAVLAAGVFEQHLRALAAGNGLSLVKESGEPKRAEALNEELTKAGAYAKGTQKEVTAKLELRNSAAHGEWTKYDQKQVVLFIEWVSFFVQKFPA